MNIINQKKIRIAFLTGGSGPLAFRWWRTLQSSVMISAVVFSRSAKSTSVWSTLREYGMWYVCQMAIKRGVNAMRHWYISAEAVQHAGSEVIYWDSSADSQKVVHRLHELGVTVVISCGFGKIFREDFLKSFSTAINVHTSALPQYRGPEPITWGLIRHEQQFGVTVHLLDAGIDTGAIIAQRVVPRPAVPLYILVEVKLSRLAGAIVSDVIQYLHTGAPAPVVQAGGAYFPMPTKRNRSTYKHTGKPGHH